MPNARSKAGPRRARAALAVLLAVGALAALPACGGRPEISLGALEPLPDAGPSEEPIPDGSILCRTDRDCGDDVACTRDVCRAPGYCQSIPDNGRCADDVFCNGLERCDPLTGGCAPGRPVQCADDDVCTVDYCEEAQKACVHEARDFDGDGEVDWHCFGGTDCDDFDVTRARAAAEICEDGLDNDCDDRVDESDCGRPEHDRCEQALDVSGGGRFTLTLAGAAPDYALGCSTEGARDVAITFVLDEPQDVLLRAAGVLADGGEETASLSLRQICDDASSEIECRRGFPGQVRRRALAAGRYFAIASSELSREIVLDVQFEPATEAPGNTTCAAPLDISDGGRFEGDFVDVGDDESIPCGFKDAEDLIYTFTLAETRDVELSAISLTGERVNLGVRTVCDDDTTTLRCLSAAPARGRFHSLAPGTYYVVAESSPSREVDFSLEVAFLDPTEPPPGDGCFDPLPLPMGEEVTGSLAGRQDLVNVVCGCSPERLASGQSCSLFLPEAVYRIDVERRTDLAIHAIAPEAPLGYELRASCEDIGTQLACDNGAALAARVRNLEPGAYFLVVESPDPATFTVRVDELPLTVPVDVSGNDTCGSAHRIPETGGLFRGDTLTLLQDYDATCGGGAASRDAAFELELTQRSEVSAKLEAVFDTVLHRYHDDGSSGDACAAQTEPACNDDSGMGNTHSLIEETLEPGTYYYVVDGFNEGNQGRYLLDVAVVPL